MPTVLSLTTTDKHVEGGEGNQDSDSAGASKLGIISVQLVRCIMGKPVPASDTETPSTPLTNAVSEQKLKGLALSHKVTYGSTSRVYIHNREADGSQVRRSSAEWSHYQGSHLLQSVSLRP